MRAAALPNLLALVACVEPHEGAWLRPRGYESGVRVFPALGPGEGVEIEVEGDPVYDKITYAVYGGVNLLALTEVTRYRAVKHGSGTPTNVEVLFHAAQRENRYAKSQQRRDG